MNGAVRNIYQNEASRLMNLKPYAPMDDWWQTQAKKRKELRKGIIQRGGDRLTVNGTLDTCFYCDRSFHPMPRWTKDNDLICVCYDQVWPDDEPRNCSDLATEGGFTRRGDLTPSR